MAKAVREGLPISSADLSSPLKLVLAAVTSPLGPLVRRGLKRYPLPQLNIKEIRNLLGLEKEELCIDWAKRLQHALPTPQEDQRKHVELWEQSLPDIIVHLTMYDPNEEGPTEHHGDIGAGNWGMTIELTHMEPDSNGERKWEVSRIALGLIELDTRSQLTHEATARFCKQFMSDMRHGRQPELGLATELEQLAAKAPKNFLSAVLLANRTPTGTKLAR